MHVYTKIIPFGYYFLIQFSIAFIHQNEAIGNLTIKEIINNITKAYVQDLAKTYSRKMHYSKHCSTGILCHTNIWLKTCK